MSKTKTPQNPIKKASLTHNEQEELVYYLREAMSRNIEAQAWNARAAKVEHDICKRLGLDPDLYEFDWTLSMEKGVVNYKKKGVKNAATETEPVPSKVS